MKVYFTEAEPDTREFFTDELAKHGVEATFAKYPSHVGEDAEVLSTFIYTQIDEEFLNAHPALKVVATRSSTMNHIDHDACRKHKVEVHNVPSYGENTVAEHTFALILALARRLPAAICQTRTQRTKAELRGFDLKGKTLGIVGVGRVGTHMIRIARGFQMEVIGYDPRKNLALAVELGFDYVPLAQLLKRSDIISLHTTLTPRTHHMFNEAAFDKCRDGALIINTSNGCLIDTKALIKALDSGKIGGAGLDVLEEEQIMQKDSTRIISEQILRNLQKANSVEEHGRSSDGRARQLKQIMQNKSLMSRPDVIVTPHIAFNSIEAVEKINHTTLDNILSSIASKKRRDSSPNRTKSMKKRYWLVKQEPEDYPWTQFLTEKGTSWTGVRNFQARNNLRAMAKGDRVLYYHSGKAREVIGVTEVARTAYPDPTAKEGDWSTVDLVPVKTLKNTVPLATVKATPELADIALVRQSRLSVMPLEKADFDRIVKLGT